MNVKAKATGDTSEAQVLAGLLRSGKIVLLPFNENQRYDLVIDENGAFRRVQVKTGRLKKGAVETEGYTYSKGKKRSYVGECEYFGIYCPDNHKVYFGPVNNFEENKKIRLWITPPTNRHVDHIAETYELRPAHRFIKM